MKHSSDPSSTYSFGKLKEHHLERSIKPVLLSSSYADSTYWDSQIIIYWTIQYIMHLARVYLRCSDYTMGVLTFFRLYSTVYCGWPLQFIHSDSPKGLKMQCRIFLFSFYFTHFLFWPIGDQVFCRPSLQEGQAIPMDFHVLSFGPSVNVLHSNRAVDFAWVGLVLDCG